MLFEIIYCRAALVAKEAMSEALDASWSVSRVPGDHPAYQIERSVIGCMKHFLQICNNLIMARLHKCSWQVCESDASRHVEALLPIGRDAADQF